MSGGVHEPTTLLPAASSSEPAIACRHGKSENDQLVVPGGAGVGAAGKAGVTPSRQAPFCPSHPALCFWTLASSPCGVANRGPAELWRGGVNVVTPLHPHCRPGSGYVSWSPSPIASAQSGGKGPHPCCPGASSPFLIPRRSSLKRLVCVFCSCWDLAGEDPSLIPTELSLKPMVVVTLFCKGHYCLQFSILCLN